MIKKIDNSVLKDPSALQIITLINKINEVIDYINIKGVSQQSNDPEEANVPHGDVFNYGKNIS